MATKTTKRFYYSDSISTFLDKSEKEIIGELALASNHDINNETSRSWVEEIVSLKDALRSYKER